MFAAGLGRGVGTFAKDYATDREMLAAAKLLVERGADVNAISVAGQTAIHFAAQAADTNLPPPDRRHGSACWLRMEPGWTLRINKAGGPSTWQRARDCGDVPEVP